MGKDAPCFGCEERILGCHSTCEKYINYRKKIDEENLRKMKEKDVDSLLSDYGKAKKFRLKRWKK